jgi:Fe-S-cluster-containing dehydrogenase component
MKIVFVSKNCKVQNTDLECHAGDDPIMIVDLDRCICCGSCQLACQIEHELPDGARIRPGSIHVRLKKGAAANTSLNLPLSCRHCDDQCEYYSTHNFWITCPEHKNDEKPDPCCDICIERLKKGFMPACVTRCSMKCIYFGSQNDVAFALSEKRLREMGDLEID